jgi:hypothetical protein
LPEWFPTIWPERTLEAGFSPRGHEGTLAAVTGVDMSAPGLVGMVAIKDSSQSKLSVFGPSCNYLA